MIVLLVCEWDYPCAAPDPAVPFPRVSWRAAAKPRFITHTTLRGLTLRVCVGLGFLRLFLMHRVAK